MSKESTLVKNTAIVTIGRICTQLISFFLLPLYTAYLTTTEYGVVDLLNTLISLITPVLIFQVDQGVFRFLIDAREDEKGQKKLISSISFFLLKQIVIYIIIFSIASIWIKNEYKYFLATNLIMTACTNVILQVARGLGDNTKYTIGSFLSGTATIILNVILIAGFHLGAYGMLYASLIGNTICTIYIFISMKIYKKLSKKYYDKGVLKSLLKYSVPLIPNAISWWIVNASDRIIITYFFNVAANGIYSVANKFSSVVMTVYNIFNITWTESVSVNFNSEDRDEYFSKIFDITIRFFGALCIGIIAFMPFVFGIMVNVDYNEAYMQIPILIIATIFNILVSFLGTIYVAKKLTKEIAKTSMFAAVINIVVNIMLINKIGLYAASISTLVAWFLMMIYRLIDTRKYIKLKIDFKLIVSMIIIYTVTVIAYYIEMKEIQLIVAIIVIIYAIYINRNNVKFITNMVKKKIHGKSY